jgi:hypothetical protein
MEIHELGESALPLFISDGGSLVLLALILAILRRKSLLSRVLLPHEGEVSLHTAVDFLIILENDVVERLVLLDLLDPVFSELIETVLDLDGSVVFEFLGHKVKNELLVFVKIAETFLIFCNFILLLLDLGVQLLKSFLLLLSLLLLVFELLFLLFSAAVVARDEEHQIGGVLFELLLREEKSLVTTLQLSLQLRDLL